MNDQPSESNQNTPPMALFDAKTVHYKKLPGEQDIELPEIDTELNSEMTQLGLSDVSELSSNLMEMISELKKCEDDTDKSMIGSLEAQMSELRSMMGCATFMSSVHQHLKQVGSEPVDFKDKLNNIKALYGKKFYNEFKTNVPRALIVIVLPSLTQHPEDPRKQATTLPVKKHSTAIYRVFRIIAHYYCGEKLIRMGVCKNFYKSLMYTAHLKKNDISEVLEIDEKIPKLHNTVVECYELACDLIKTEKNKKKSKSKSRK